MEWPKEFLAIVDDPLLADVKPKPAAATVDDRMQQKIDELKAWIADHGREPSLEASELNEKLKAKSLETLKNNGLWM